MKFNDLTGKRFGMLTVISMSDERKCNQIQWNVICDCGKERLVSGCNLVTGSSTSCGCLRRKNDLTGKRFGRLLVISHSHINKKHKSCWNVVCDCGTEKTVLGVDLVFSGTKSCGCLNREITSKLCKAKIGHLHPNWNPKITDKERMLARNYPEYKEWRDAVFSRDDFICQKCGKRGVTLNAHHIESYSNHLELRTTLENGITLCANKCHKNLHHIYGYDVGRENLEAWMGERAL